MAYIAVDKSGREAIFSRKPKRVLFWGSNTNGKWSDEQRTSVFRDETKIFLPKGSVEKLLGRELTWEDEPVKL